MKTPPKIIYHHIPKCGGTSILRGLAITYYPMRLLRYGKKGFPGTLNARAASAIAKDQNINTYSYRRQILSYFVEDASSPLIFGHYPFSEDVYAKHHADWDFVTLLRDPLKRWYSEYNWNRFKSHDYAKTDLNVEEYFESDQGKRDARSFVNFLMHAGDPHAKASDAEAKRAIENLEKFRVVGVLENLDRFRDDLKAAFGRRPVFAKQNQSPAASDEKAKPDENSDFHKKLMEYLAADIEIYQAALKRLS